MLGSAIRVLVLGASMLAVAAVAVLGSRLAFAAVLLAWLIVLFVAVVWLPRAAHRAFARGSYRRARLLYRLLGLTVLSESSRAAIAVSLAACGLAAEDWHGALAKLERLDPSALGDGGRAAWLNNRAYALVRSGGDLRTALACSDEAIQLRPDVAGFRHTRGVVLLALGRVDEAIAELDRIWEELAGEAADEVPLLEAERCYDLGVAWTQKGEHDYAADYFQRARRASPGSRWAVRASREIAAVTKLQPGDAAMIGTALADIAEMGDMGESETAA